MIRFTTGNLLDADAEALVNTVNTVGVMGKGIALMFKEAFPENFRAYEKACKNNGIETGRVFVTERAALIGPKWIINFPTKRHWRHPSRIEWIEQGLDDLVRVIRDKGIGSIALPPLGSGNGGLDWTEVRPLIERSLGAVPDVDVLVFEPTQRYQNVMKRSGVETLTPARAMIVELVRRYEVMGFECSILEIQKLAYFLERYIRALALRNTLDLRFQADRYGPFAPRLTHLLDGLDGSYLHCGKRLADAGPWDAIWFEDSRRDHVAAYLGSDGKDWLPALNATSRLVDGFESPLGLELLATVDWLIDRRDAPATADGIRAALADWPGGGDSARRKMRLFDDRLIGIALERLSEAQADLKTLVPG
ncbi:type II toxin-antitoxin system antitoxin DNA ADP-ribosyl glycohydrolase DarG [Rhodospira trueperi]|uniref:O-acetyl-ADP-ribose deacetylase (Regulator of RNase III), contains Macro domain n=1 Tax=Rhodospira trueperi TaxID=69960 RepID=A0A1G6YUL3_9PROT|nr:macro domain-containing protein [Rhodospira trueperi]SDD94089.1 O-acetyl-ADP-ribose deacetylase (regulator of RNase III), contains Macro domain [Rhodospira trueperi]